MVRVIKWHINIKAYNTVTLSFIASINPQRHSFHSQSGQIVSPRCPQHVVLKHLHLSPFIYLSIQAHLAIGFQLSISSEVAMMLLGVSMRSFCHSVCGAKPQRLLWIPHQRNTKISIFCSKVLSEELCYSVYKRMGKAPIQEWINIRNADGSCDSRRWGFPVRESGKIKVKKYY